MPILEEDEFFESSCKGRKFQRSGSIICPVPLPSLLLIDTLSRKSISYHKIPQEPLRLTVRKLDGTSFDIQVPKNGTVAELKKAVETAFGHLPQSGPGKVSWSHVWGHFCLSYDGCKLINDGDYIGCYEIKDGDQLHFIRHVSINYNMIRTRSEREDHSLEKPSFYEGSDGREQSGYKDQCHEQNIESCEADNKSDVDNEDNVDDDCEKVEDHGVIMGCEYKLAQMFRGWFSYRKLTDSDMRIERRSCSPKLSNSFLGSFKNVLRLHTNKYDSSQRVTWKAE